MNFSEIEENKKPHFGENEEIRMKEYLEGTLDSTKIQQPKIESKTLAKKEEKINEFQNQQKDNKIQTISPERIYSTKNSPQKGNQNLSTKQIQSEKSDENKSLTLKLCKLRPHIINLFSIFQSLSIALNESNFIKISSIIEKIVEAVNIFYINVIPNCKLSEIVSLFDKVNYLYTIKQELESIEKNIEFSKIDNDWKINVINKSNILENEIKSSLNTTQEDNSEKKDKNFLNKKRIFTVKKDGDNKIKRNKEDIINGKDDNNLIDVQIPKKKPLGRIPEISKHNGIKGAKDDTHPANGLIKMLRHCLSNLFDILVEIINELDNDIKIFFPGINDKDLKNATKQENYIKKNY